MTRQLRHTYQDPNQLSLQLDFSLPSGSQEPSVRLWPTDGTHNNPTATATPDTGRTSGGGDQDGSRRHIQLGNESIEYRLTRSKRRTIGFLIDDQGLRMSAPRWVPLQEIETAIREKQRWIIRKLHESRERRARPAPAPMRWTDGARLAYLGGEIKLIVLPAMSESVRFDAPTNELRLELVSPFREQQVKELVLTWLQHRASQLFRERLGVYAERLGVRWRHLRLSSARTQWGSCSIDGSVRLNWRLIHFPLDLIDYVVAHELSHLHEMNHSPRFWAWVGSVFPDYAAARQRLREHALSGMPAL